METGLIVQLDDKYSYKICKSYDWLKGSYMSLIEENDFLKDPTKFIENAYDKSQSLNNYKPLKEKQIQPHNNVYGELPSGYAPC